MKAGEKMNDLQGKVVLITGAAHPQGIGRAIAESLGRKGAHVLVGDIDRVHMDQATKDFRDMGISASVYDMDVSDFEQVELAVEKMTNEVGPIDVLVNNVGGTSRVSREEMSEDWEKKKKGLGDRKPMLGVTNSTNDQWHKIMNVNLNSAFYCSKAILPQMMERRQGRIVNFASIVGQRGVNKTESFTSGPYAVAKAGIIGLTRQLALETAEFGITVNCVAPGYVRSGRGQMIEALPSEQVEALLQTIPMGRLAETDEIASVVLGLCTDQFRYVTGQTININGGMYFS